MSIAGSPKLGLCWQQSCYIFTSMDRRSGKGVTPKLKARRAGRPRIHAEPWAKVSVVLFERQVIHLDRVTEKVRQRGNKITRACLIRGLIDGVLASGIDLCHHPSEAAVRDHLAARLRERSSTSLRN